MRFALLALALFAAVAVSDVAAADPLPVTPPRIVVHSPVEPDCIIIDPPVIDVECIPIVGGT